MQKIILFVLILIIMSSCNKSHQVAVESTAINEDSVNILNDAYKSKTSDIQIQGRGVVDRVLSDDLDGSRHQRFIIKLSNGQKLLVAHNIDLAPKIIQLNVGDKIEFYGEYEWNDKGGVIHWTHHDPKNYHVSGWLKHKGNTYQ